MKVVINADGTLLVDVCYTHHGHKVQLEHTRIAKGRREQIAVSLQQGVAKERILNDLREDGLKSETLKRHHLIGKKDIANIKTSFQLDDVRRHPDDQSSVKAWVDERSSQENNFILFSKFQGDF